MGQAGAKRRKRLVLQPVVQPAPSALRADEPGVSQNAEMVGKEVCRDRTDGRLDLTYAVRPILQYRHDLQPHRIRQCLESSRPNQFKLFCTNHT